MWAILLCVAVLAGGERATPASSDGIEFFEKKVRPVIVEHCYECHSSASKKVKGGLLLDSRVEILKGGSSGPAIVLGNPDKSLIIQAVRGEDPVPSTMRPP